MVAMQQAIDKPMVPVLVENEVKEPLASIVTEGRLKVDRALAQRILDEANYSRQRKLYPHHVELLAESMRRGRWTAGSQIAFAVLRGELHLVNGQHRMAAVIAAGGRYEFQVLLLTCRSEPELHSLYYRFDAEARQRSTAEILNAVDFADGNAITKRMAKTVYDASIVLHFRFERPNYQIDPVAVRSFDYRLDLAQPWAKFGAIYDRLITDAPARIKTRLMRPTIAAVALATIKHAPEQAEQFWKGIAENDGLRRGDPRHTAILDLINRDLDKAQYNAGAVAVAAAWNAFVEERQLNHTKVYDTSTVKIALTPYDGKKR